MHIVLVDDSIPFDGYSPSSQPLAGAEKAFASLPGALARRGHRVQVFNRAADVLQVDGAAWETWQGTRPVACDVLIAFRKPELLGFVASASHKILWLAAPAGYLAGDSAQGLLYAHRPTLVFMGEAHRATYRADDTKLSTTVIPPGIRPQYLEAPASGPDHPPYAIATSHPQLGLDWLIRLWIERVYPQCPHATLRVYSAALDRAFLGGIVPEPLKAIAALALGAQDKGVAIHRPGADPALAEAYGGARVHLYPGDPREVYCHTLADSQACGTPGLARPFPATAEQIADGVSGHLAADEEAFARHTLSLLEDDAAYQRLREGVRAQGAGRGWDAAAEAFEAIWR
jgi:glycosyltransferase involved in cell wall biosynthesis